MESILYQLFSGDYDITSERGNKQQELCSQISAEMEKVQAVFGIDFVNHLFDLEAEEDVQENYQYYRSGFLTGARLMLEVLN